MNRELYNALADVLTYPQADYLPRLERCVALAATARGEPERESKDLAFVSPHDLLARFTSDIRGLSMTNQQELFTQTFDLNPVCSLELGWHLFGENYDRGLLLVKMRQQLRLHGLEESAELPDHLTYALRLLAYMEYESAAVFAEAIVLPAVEKMLEALRGKENLYQDVLEAVRGIVHADFPEIQLGHDAGNEPVLRILA